MSQVVRNSTAPLHITIQIAFCEFLAQLSALEDDAKCSVSMVSGMKAAKWVALQKHY